MSESTDAIRQWPTLRYETRDGEVITLEADFIAIVGAGRDDHIWVSRAVAVVETCDIRAHSCRIEAEGCVVRPLARDDGLRRPNTGEL